MTDPALPSFICPVCHERQTDIWVSTDYALLDPNIWALNYRCPNCDSLLSSDYAKLFDEREHCTACRGTGFSRSGDS